MQLTLYQGETNNIVKRVVFNGDKCHGEKLSRKKKLCAIYMYLAQYKNLKYIKGFFFPLIKAPKIISLVP